MSEEGYQEMIRTEYLECGTNWRYWGDVRFKQLTVYLTANGVLGAGAFGILSKLKTSHPLANLNEHTVDYNLVVVVALALCGLALAAFFFVLEERATCYRRAFVRHAVRLESALGLMQYRSTRIGSGLRSNTIYGYLFLAFSAVWSGVLWQIVLGSVWVTFGLVTVFGLVFTLVAKRIRKGLKASSSASFFRPIGCLLTDTPKNKMYKLAQGDSANAPNQNER